MTDSFAFVALFIVVIRALLLFRRRPPTREAIALARCLVKA